MTIFYNVPSTADSTATLATGGIIRYGIELNGATSALVAKQISTFTVSLKKAATPSGNVTAVVRRASDDAVVATFQESLVATSLTTSFLPYTFTLASPYTLVNGDKIMIEYSGAASILIEVYTTDQFDGSLTRRVRFTSPTYATGNTNDIVATITDGIFVSNEDTHKYKIRTLASNTLTSIYRVIKIPIPYSFSALSFSSSSFTVSPVPVITTGGGGRRRNRFRAWIAGWARDLRNFFKIKQRPPEPEDAIIPEAQPPKIFHILPSPPTMETKLETLNDKWTMPPMSVVASSPPPTIYPLILNPITSPLIQTKVTLPRAIKQPYIEPYRVGEGSHIESKVIGLKRPRNRSKTASTINTLMILLEIERQV